MSLDQPWTIGHGAVGGTYEPPTPGATAWLKAVQASHDGDTGTVIARWDGYTVADLTAHWRKRVKDSHAPRSWDGDTLTTTGPDHTTVRTFHDEEPTP